VSDVDPEWRELTCHRLREVAQPSLRRREGREVGLAAQRRTGAGEEQRAATARLHHARRLAAEEEAAEATHSPALLEVVGLHRQQIAGHVVAGVVDRDADGPDRLRLAEELDHRGLGGGVGLDPGRFPALAANLVGHAFDLLGRATRYHHVEPALREAMTQRCAQPLLRSDSDHDRGIAHVCSSDFRLRARS
jgi:hypothetical protein